MKTKTKKMMLAILSIALVAAISVAGTFAYLQSTSDDVVNTFSTNSVKVELKETTGNDYNIVPGTSQDKDPKVTVDNTVDSYVYVKVTDETGGLVTYEIADGWTALDGYEGVYYREVAENEDPKTFSVLKDDKVSYSSSLTNDDMPDGDVNLTFTAYAIQQAGFDDEEAAWRQIPVIVQVDNSEDFIEAVKNSNINEVVQLTEDIEINSSIPQSTTGVTNIDLNGKTMTSTAEYSTIVKDGDSLIIENGSVIFKGQGAANSSIGVKTNAVVTLKDVNLSTSGAAIYPQGDAAEVNVIDSKITSTGSYCVATNAATFDNYNVKINLSNSDFTGPSPIMINVPGNLNMENCTVTAEMHGVIVRGGTAIIKDCEIGNTSTDKQYEGYFDNRNWGSGNMLPLAGVTIGNKSAQYQYPSKVTLTNTTVTSNHYPTIYIYGNANEENGATLNYDTASDVGEVIYGGGYVVINGEVQDTTSGN